MCIFQRVSTSDGDGVCRTLCDETATEEFGCQELGEDSAVGVNSSWHRDLRKIRMNVFEKTSEIAGQLRKAARRRTNGPRT